MIENKSGIKQIELAVKAIQKQAKEVAKTDKNMAVWMLRETSETLQKLVDWINVDTGDKQVA